MKIAVLIARLLLGLVFVVFGSNYFFHFIPAPPMTGDTGVLMGILASHGWMAVVASLEVIGGILLLVGLYVPIGLTVLGPIIFNALVFHLCFNPAGIGLALVSLLLQIFLIYAYRSVFAGFFQAKPVVL